MSQDKMSIPKAAEVILYCWKHVFGVEPALQIRGEEIFVDRTFTFYREEGKAEPWGITMDVHIPATREDPPDVDVVDVCSGRGFFPALRTLLEFIADDRINNAVNDEANAYWYEQSEKEE